MLSVVHARNIALLILLSSNFENNAALLSAAETKHTSLFSIENDRTARKRNGSFNKESHESVEMRGLKMSLFDDINEKNEVDEMANFNPFNYNRATSGTGDKTSTYASERQVISLRKTTMTELVGELLNTDASPEAMEPVLKKYQEFLLEPLNDMDAVLEPDSIYRGNMTREQRYQAYQGSMEERIEKARNTQGKKVLTAMKDFVLSFK